MASFYMPARVFEEEDAVPGHAGDLAALGRRALVVTGRRSAFSNGVWDDLKAALDRGGVEYVLFPEVEENPSVETVMRARDLGVSEGVDFVIGAGGGSALDAAKAISMMIKNPSKGAEYLYTKDPSATWLPVAAIPTTCGTGSEVTGVSVLTNTEKGVKGSIPAKIFPALALIDGKYLKGAPFSVLANTAFDALTHLIESELNSNATVYSRMCTSAGLSLWAESLPVFRREREADAGDLRNMMRAAMMAGMGIAQTGTSLPHALSYHVTVKLGVPHGKACAYFIAGYLMEAPSAAREEILAKAGFASVEDYRDVFYRACGPMDFPENELAAVLAESAARTAGNPAKLSLAPFPADEAMLRRIAFFENESERTVRY